MDPDSLTTLEERIRKAADLVSRLRREKEDAVTVAAEIDPLKRRIAELTSQLEAACAERDTLKVERETVRKRVERLLEQIDALGTS
jgi:chromosome segregation ATPase